VKLKKSIKFSKEWSKLKDNFFLTVRWGDATYVFNSIIPVIVKGKTKFYGQIAFTLDVKLRDLLYEQFVRYDADCDVKQYYSMLKGWYSRKSDWKEENSIVRIVGIRKAKPPVQRIIKG